MPPRRNTSWLRLAGDRLVWIGLVWFLLAFVLRPAAMAAHYGDAAGLAGWIGQWADGAVLARLVGFIQWASLAGLILLLALGHVRFIVAMPPRANAFAGRLLVGFAYAVAFSVGYLAFIWTPTTAVSLMLHDSFIFFDAMHRIDHGQRPSVDFPTALGAAMLYLPWLGSKLAGGYAGAIELSSAAVALLLCLACAQACAVRHGPAVTAVLVAAVFLIVVPAMLEGYDAPSSNTYEAGEYAGLNEYFANAMFYNRWGWGALIAVFAFLTPREKEAAAPIAEIVTLGLILAFLFWVKISYFAVAGAAAVLYAFLGARPWRTLMIGAGVSLAGILAVALFTGNLLPYIGDVLAVGRVSGFRFTDVADLVKDNLLELILGMSPFLAIGLLGKLRREDYWIAGLILLGTLFIINQNAQTSGLPTLLVASAYAVWRLREDESRPLRLLAALAFALPAATYVMDRASGLLGQTTVARREEARPPPLWADIPALRNVYAQEREDVIARVEAAHTADEKLQAFRGMALLGRRQFLRSAEYVATLKTATEELRPLMRPGETVVELDFASPLAFLTETRPAKGYWITFDDGRTIDETTYPDPESLFADADHVLSPKLFVEPDTGARLRLLYSDWLDENYGTRVETLYWTRWSHRKPGLRPSTQLR
jgi:hypothetical protein